MIIVYHYIAANKVLYNKNHYSSYKCGYFTDNFFSFDKYFIRITKLYICIVIVKIRNIV